MKCKLLRQLISMSRYAFFGVLMQCWFCSTLLASIENAPAITVSGTVTSQADGEGLPGVNVLVKGTTNTGTISDIEGNYSINVPNEDDILVFSSIGYITQEVAVNGRSEINVALVEDVQSLEEIVVVGYGTVEKSDLTGSVSSISTEDFNPGVNASVDQLMQGRAAGVQINQTSGEPGGGISVRIRGSSSINAGNGPLYVIDGFPIDNSPPLSRGGVAGIGNIENSKNPLNALEHVWIWQTKKI